MKRICFYLITIMLLSTAFFYTNCDAFERPATDRKGIHGHVLDESDYPINNAVVTSFDGFTLKEVKTDTNGEFNISDIPVSKNNYLVIFFTKEQFIPRAENIKAGDDEIIKLDVVINKVSTDNSGFVIGVVYQPIRGGKLQYHKGIKSFAKNKDVLLETDGSMLKKETDLNGHFIFDVPPGIYTLSKEGGKEKYEIEISPGKTIIKNLRSGFVLID